MAGGYNPPTYSLIFAGVTTGPATYVIVNTVNGREYIGCTKNLFVRLKKHFGRLACGTHSNPGLQVDYDEHGLDVFEVYVLKYEKNLLLEGILTKLSPNCYNESGRKGRMHCKFDHTDHLRMTKLRAEGCGLSAIAAEFGTSDTYVCHILKGWDEKATAMLALYDSKGRIRPPKTLRQRVFPTRGKRGKLQSGSV